MITALSGKGKIMKRKDQNFMQDTGYMPQGGYPQGSYPAGGAGYQGYPSQQGQQAAAGYNQPQGYQQPQGYAQGQGYPRQGGYFQNPPMPQMPGAAGARSYQTPQVAGGQTSPGTAEPSYVGQGSFSQSPYQPQGYQQPQAQTGYQAAQPYPQQTGYQPNMAGGTPGYSYPGSQAPAGSYIPQTPYSQGYVTPGYQAQTQTGYTQAYSAYTQMGRAPQNPVSPAQGPGGQVPLNGGGYVPTPVPVRKKPFEMTDAYLLILCAVLLVLFAMGMFIPGLGALKWLFLILAAGAAALFWIKPMIASNKRLCFSIVFGMLMLVTVIGLVTGGAGNAGVDRTNEARNANAAAGMASQDQEGSEQYSQQRPVTQVTPAPEETPDPDVESRAISERLHSFFECWVQNDFNGMMKLCSPKWVNKVSSDNPNNALFNLLGNKRPTDINKCTPENLSGTSQDTSRVVTILVEEMDRNDGKSLVDYRYNVIMEKYDGDGLWYVDPQSLKSYEPMTTPSETETPAPTPTPETLPTTKLYYNPDGGKQYHRDPNCSSTNKKYLPFKGSFTVADLEAGKYDNLSACPICGAPLKGE